jgi:hypothetical protein
MSELLWLLFEQIDELVERGRNWDVVGRRDVDEEDTRREWVFLVFVAETSWFVAIELAKDWDEIELLLLLLMMPEFFETTATAAVVDEEEIEAVVAFAAETEAVVVLVVLMKEEGVLKLYVEVLPGRNRGGGIKLEADKVEVRLPFRSTGLFIKNSCILALETNWDCLLCISLPMLPLLLVLLFVLWSRLLALFCEANDEWFVVDSFCTAVVAPACSESEVWFPEDPEHDELLLLGKEFVLVVFWPLTCVSGCEACFGCCCKNLSSSIFWK